MEFGVSFVGQALCRTGGVLLGSRGGGRPAEVRTLKMEFARIRELEWITIILENVIIFIILLDSHLVRVSINENKNIYFRKPQW